ncbi:MAG: GNAT family N-acetyltransferase [Chloroflexota bacterium]
MQIVEFHDQLLPSLTRLINQHMAAVPPGFTFSEALVGQIIRFGGSLWDIHYPGDREVFHTETLCVLEHHEVVAAAQWLMPNEHHVFSILWIVAAPDRPIPARTLLHLMNNRFSKSGCEMVNFSRFSFGVGWFGIPVKWKHIISPMLEAGYRQTEKWRIMHGKTDLPREAPAPSVENLQFYWNMNKPALEWDLSVYQGDSTVGECHVWGIPPHLEDYPAAPAWATVEWIGIEPPFRRNGIGRRLLAEQMRFHGRRGVTDLLLWKPSTHRASSRLYKSLGFVNSLELAVLERS